MKSPHTLIERLRENLVKLATKQDGYGMSFHAAGIGRNGCAELHLYGDRANAAYQLLEEGAELGNYIHDSRN